MFAWSRETGGHAAFNAWDRTPYLTIVDGAPSSYPMWSHISRNYIIAEDFPSGGKIKSTPNSDWGIDFDDGSSFYDVAQNVLLYGNVKTHGGGSKRVHHNLIIHPDVPVDGHGCYTAQSSCVEDVFFFENVCELATDPLHPRPDQTGQHAAVLYDLNAHCGSSHFHGAEWLGLPQLRANRYSFPGTAGTAVGINCGNATLASVQAHGSEAGSSVSAPIGTAGLMAQARALLAGDAGQ